MTPVLLVNAIVTPDGTRLESVHRHDYRTHLDANGETYMVDGGLSYIRRSINKEKAREISVYSSEPHEVIREEFTWGTYGKGGKGPLQRKILSTLDDDHIEAILATQTHIGPNTRKVFEDEQEFRKAEHEKNDKSAC